MEQRPAQNVVTVTIAGESYTLRAHASPEYTQRCAALVDQTISEILGQGSLVEAQKAYILAALSLADSLLQAQGETKALEEEIGRLAGRLAADIRASVSADLASGG